jgi:hypothetical protein
MVRETPRYPIQVRWIALLLLWVFTIAFDSVMLWAVDFTLGWGGDAIGVGILASLAVIVTACALYLTSVYRRDRGQIT